MKKVFILILNYNGFDDLSKCLKTLIKLEDKSYSIKTVVIDNGSSKEQLKMLKALLKEYRGIELVENKKNLGFARGNNVGIRYALKNKADYVLLLNNDTEIEMNFLKKLIKLDYPISSPVVKFREFKEHPKLIYDLGGYVNWRTGRTTHLNCYANEYKKLNKGVNECDYVAGCCMLVKREVFESIGLLDEKYFIYFEDVDFCVTAIKNGYKVAVDQNAVISHKLGGSMDRWSNRAIYHHLLANFIFISKHLGWHRITGYSYLFALTAKIVFDRVRGYISKEIH